MSMSMSTKGCWMHPGEGRQTSRQPAHPRWRHTARFSLELVCECDPSRRLAYTL